MHVRERTFPANYLRFRVQTCLPDPAPTPNPPTSAVIYIALRSEILTLMSHLPQPRVTITMMTRTIQLNTNSNQPDPTTQHILSHTGLDVEHWQDIFKE